MTDYQRKETHTCCDDAWYKWKNTENEGSKIYAYSKCQNCGAEWRDVFMYNHAEVDVDTLKENGA